MDTLSGHSFVMLYYRHNRPQVNVIVFYIFFIITTKSSTLTLASILIRILGVRSIGKIGWLKVQKKTLFLLTFAISATHFVTQHILWHNVIMVNNVKGFNSYLGQKSFIRRAGRRFFTYLIFEIWTYVVCWSLLTQLARMDEKVMRLVNRVSYQ